MSKEKVSFEQAVRRQSTKHINRYLEVCGADPQQTIQFLLVLGKLLKEKDKNHESIKKIVQRVNRKVVFGSARWFVNFCKHCPENLDNLGHICRALFFTESKDGNFSKKLLTLFIQTYELNEREYDGLESKTGRIIVGIIQYFSAIFEDSQMAMRAYLDCLDAKDDEAITIFVRYLTILSYRVASDLIIRSYSAFLLQNKDFAPGHSYLIVPDEHLILVKKLYYSLNEYEHAQMKPAHKFVEWFADNLDFFEELRKIYWQDIANNPLRLLRPDGRDKIKIAISPLNNSVMRFDSIQLFREGGVFPVCIFRVWSKIHNLVVFSDFSLDGRELHGYREEKTDDLSNIYMQLYAFIATHCYWIIVCSETTSVSKNSKKCRKMNEQAQEMFEVRDHTRTLPEGWQASEEAKAKAAKLNVPLLSHKTFVGAFWKHVTQAERKKMEEIIPLFTYDEKDILYK